jgi:hypothetical protein
MVVEGAPHGDIINERLIQIHTNMNPSKVGEHLLLSLMETEMGGRPRYPPGNA